MYGMEFFDEIVVMDVALDEPNLHSVTETDINLPAYP
jgi:hypothetical protein